MKYLVVIFSLAIFVNNKLIAQDTIRVKKVDGEVFTVVEEVAEFPGGPAQMNNFIRQNLVFPQVVLKDGNFSGCKVFLKFIVDIEGNVIDPVILKGCSYKECDEEAIRVIKLMPKWKPAKMSGRNVNTYYNLPFNFKVSQPNTENNKQK